MTSDFAGKRESATCLVRAVRTLNISTAVVQMLAGAGFLSSLLVLDVPSALVAVYSMLFALLLLLFECRFRMTDVFLRQYFGFLFTYRGLGAFLLMVGILDLGMASGLFGLVAGATACVNAMIVFFVGCCAPRVRASAATDLPTINIARVPSYGSSATKAPSGQQLADVTAPSAAALSSSSGSKKQSKKKSSSSSSSLLNTTLNL